MPWIMKYRKQNNIGKGTEKQVFSDNRTMQEPRFRNMFYAAGKYRYWAYEENSLIHAVSYSSCLIKAPREGLTSLVAMTLFTIHKQRAKQKTQQYSQGYNAGQDFQGSAIGGGEAAESQQAGQHRGGHRLIG